MKTVLYLAGAMPPYNLYVRVYLDPPKDWDGCQYLDTQYHLVHRTFFELLGIAGLPAPASRAVQRVELGVHRLEYVVNGDTLEIV